MTTDQICAVAANVMMESVPLEGQPLPTSLLIDTSTYREYLWAPHCPHLKKIADAHSRTWRFEGEPAC